MASRGRKCIPHCNIGCCRWVKRSIWIVCIVTMLSLTITDLIPLLDEFKDTEKNMVTYVSIAKNKTVSPPTPAVCVPYYSSALDNIEIWLETLDPNRDAASSSDEDNGPPHEYEAMRNHSWGMWDLNYTNYEDMLENSASKIVKRVLNEGNGFPTLHLNTTGFNWNQPIIDVVWRYLSDITGIDSDLASSSLQSIVENNNTLTRNTLNFTLIGPVANAVIDQLFDRVIGSLVVKMGHTDSSYKKSEIPPMVIFGDRLCIQVDPNRTEEAIRKGEHFLYEYTTKQQRDYAVVSVFRDPSYLYSNDMYSDALYRTDANESPVVHAEFVTLSYTVQAKFTENRTRKICSKDITPAICLARSHVTASMRYCHCVPFAFRFLESNPGNLPYCSDRRYELCMEKLVEEKEKARLQCNEECEHTFYTYKVDSWISKEANATNTTFVGVNVKATADNTYLEFAAVDKTTLQQFFSQLGGSVGLYLGLSGLSVATLILLCIDEIIRRREKRKGSDIQSSGHFAWGLLWTRGLLNVRVNDSANDQGVSINADHIHKEIEEVKKENCCMREKNSRIKEENRCIREENNRIKEEIEIMKQRINELYDRPR